MLILIGESGCGKTTIANYLEKLGLTQIQSYTTREPRYEGEVGHTFVSDAEFDKLENMIAYTEYDGHRYCATADQARTHDVYVLDPNGVQNLQYDGECIFIRIVVSEEERIRRMLARGDTPADVRRRIEVDREEFATIDDYLKDKKTFWVSPEVISL